ncbi:hypothetical protein, partial [Stenotrophomonas maltophilia]|uniref:hypothetical protein n=1 Tax=Stenotrophomonas maltophilia TaxID=40324 RepID=UPI0019545A05
LRVGTPVAQDVHRSVRIRDCDFVPCVWQAVDKSVDHRINGGIVCGDAPSKGQSRRLWIYFIRRLYEVVFVLVVGL